MEQVINERERERQQAPTNPGLNGTRFSTVPGGDSIIAGIEEISF